MDPEAKKRWVDALRGGEYKQGRAMMKAYGLHCCLGVLCEVEKLPQEGSDGRVWFLEKGTSSASYLLPNEFRERMGIQGREESVLVKMNDRGDSFEKIADWIEENL